VRLFGAGFLAGAVFVDEAKALQQLLTSNLHIAVTRIPYLFARTTQNSFEWHKENR
jgi:hypothetical protein